MVLVAAPGRSVTPGSADGTVGLAAVAGLPLVDFPPGWAIRHAVEAMKARQPVQVELTREDVQRLVQALAGLTLNQARRVIAQVILADGKLSPIDVERVVHLKGEIIDQGGMLEFYPAEGYHRDYFALNPNQPYCQVVVAPKVAKFRKKYMDRLKA